MATTERTIFEDLSKALRVHIIKSGAVPWQKAMNSLLKQAGIYFVIALKLIFLLPHYKSYFLI
jgi:hypothetical protein